jgi:hypothetical protein
VTFDCYSNGQYQWLKQVSLPYTNMGAFHNYSIHYFPTYFSFYADNTLLASFNATSLSNGILPSRPMALWFYITASTTSQHVTDAMYVKSASYKLGAYPFPSRRTQP